MLKNSLESSAALFFDAVVGQSHAMSCQLELWDGSWCVPASYLTLVSPVFDKRSQPPTDLRGGLAVYRQVHERHPI